MSKFPIIKTPCKNCPFRKDSLKGWLGEKIMTEFLESDTFVCHKTTKGTPKERKQCAGFMIIQGDKSAAVIMSKILKINLNLKGQDLIFENKKDCINHHKKYETK